MNVLKKLCAGVLGAAFIASAFSTAYAETAADSKTETQAVTEEAQPATDDKGQKISINLAARSLALIRNNAKIRLYPIGPGKSTTPTPTGYYKILTKEVNPTWVDPSDPEFSIPSGASNPLGFRWMQFYGNYGIHGTNKPDYIGKYVSNGCIRMNEKDVEALFDMVEVGTPVEITYNRVVVEKTPDDTVAYYIYPDGYGWQKLAVKDVERWLAGYGVDNFVPTADIEKKIAASDGQPTYIAKVYPLYVNGKKLKTPAVVQDNVTYLPAVDLAEATQVYLGWKPQEKVLTSTYGEAVGYDKKGVLYCNADDVEQLFHLNGSISSLTTTGAKNTTNTKAGDEIAIVRDGKPVSTASEEGQEQSQNESKSTDMAAQYYSVTSAAAPAAQTVQGSTDTAKTADAAAAKADDTKSK